MERIKTGIPGFDSLIDGGFPSGKVILLSGTPGTCKTIFALQYLFNGAVNFKERGLYVTFEEGEQNLKSQAIQFGWDFDKLEKEKKVNILTINPNAIKETTAKDIIKLAKNNGVKRIVVDSLTALAINAPTTYTKVTELTEISIKRFVYQFISSLRTEIENATILLITQTSDGHLSKDSVSEFICDGIVTLSFDTVGGGFSRSLQVRKMRQTDNDDSYHPLEITKNGLKVHNLE